MVAHSAEGFLYTHTHTLITHRVNIKLKKKPKT